jgi:hypothetical protein
MHSKTKKADAAEYAEELGHIGLLVIKPAAGPGRSAFKVFQ